MPPIGGDEGLDDARQQAARDFLAVGQRYDFVACVLTQEQNRAPGERTGESFDVVDVVGDNSLLYSTPHPRRVVKRGGNRQRIASAQRIAESRRAEVPHLKGR